MIHTTHTYAVLDVEGSTFRDVARRLREAKYDHAFNDDGDGTPVIDMHGIALRDAGMATATISCSCGGVFKVDLPDPMPPVEAYALVMGQHRYPDVTALQCPYDTTTCGVLVQIFGVVSSHVRDAGWCEFISDGDMGGRTVLRVHLRSGAVGEYEHVTEQWWEQFITAESKGKFLSGLIKNKIDYPWTRLR